MGRLSKKISITAGAGEPARKLDMRLMHKARRLVNETNYIDKKKYWELVNGARSHALWLHMSVLKAVFRFTSAQLKEYYKELKTVYEYAFNYNKVKESEILDGVKYVVNANPKTTIGGMGYTGYKFQKFDADGQAYDRINENEPDTKKALFRYNCVKRTVLEFCHSELASMLVLHDAFGFRAKRLERFIGVVRNTFREGKCEASENVAYLEHLCKCRFSEFDSIRTA